MVFSDFLNNIQSKSVNIGYFIPEYDTNVSF